MKKLTQFLICFICVERNFISTSCLCCFPTTLWQRQDTNYVSFCCFSFLLISCVSENAFWFPPLRLLLLVTSDSVSVAMWVSCVLETLVFFSFLFYGSLVVARSGVGFVLCLLPFFWWGVSKCWKLINKLEVMMKSSGFLGLFSMFSG